MACETRCELDDILYSGECQLRGGIKSLYWARYTDIDWETIETTPALWDNATQTLNDYAMVGANVFHKIEFDKKLANYTIEYTEETGLYAYNINIVLDGVENYKRLALVNAIQCCDLVIHTFGWDCSERLFGVGWDGSTFFDRDITPLKIVTHNIFSGAFGDGKPRHEITFGGESVYESLIPIVEEANIPV